MNKLCGSLSGLVLALTTHAAAAECLHYDLPSVQITGRITRVAYPSAFSNEPSREPDYVWYFDTAEPLCIVAGNKRMRNVPFAKVQHFEILPPPDGQDLARFLGVKVALKGQFLPSQLPHYHHLTFSVESASLQPAP